MEPLYLHHTSVLHLHLTYILRDIMLRFIYHLYHVMLLPLHRAIRNIWLDLPDPGFDICDCRMTLTTSTGHATTSCANPPMQPAMKIALFVAFPRSPTRCRNVWPYTPKNTELITPYETRGNPIPRKKPFDWRFIAISYYYKIWIYITILFLAHMGYGQYWLNRVFP